MRIVYVVSDIAPLCCFEDETASRAYAGMFEHYTVTPCLLAGAYESLDIAEAAGKRDALQMRVSSDDWIAINSNKSAADALDAPCWDEIADELAEAAEAAREGIFDPDVMRNIADDGAMLLRKEGVEHV